MAAFARAILLILITFLVHFSSTQNGFVYDDNVHIQSSTVAPTEENIKEVFLRPMYPGNLYRPMVTLSYMFTHKYYELEPYYYHLSNVILHTATAFLLFCLLGLFLTSNYAFLVSLLFAVHPVTAEVVANVSGRAEILAAFFGFLSLLFYLGGDFRKIPLILSLPLGTLFLAAAFLSKESALVFPLLYILLRTFSEGRRYIRSAALPLVAFAFLIPLYLYFRFEFLDIRTLSIPYIDNPLAALEPSERIHKAILLLGKYLALLLFPIQLSSDYSFAHLTPDAIAIASTTEWNVAAFLVGVFGLCSFTYLWNREEFPFFCMWFFLSFVVTANIFFPIGTIFAERLAYLPAIGAVGALVTLFAFLLPSYAAQLLVVLFVAVFSYKTYIAEQYWKSDETLVARQITVSPNSARTLFNYGIYLRNKGDFDKAKEQFESALHIHGEYAEATYGLATIAVHNGNNELAKEKLEQALAMNPDYLPANTMLGRIFLVEEKTDDAKKNFLYAYGRDSRNEEALLGLLAVSLREKNLEMAELWYRRLERLPSTHREFLRLQKLLKDFKAGKLDPPVADESIPEDDDHVQTTTDQDTTQNEQYQPLTVENPNEAGS